jgi:hypothetical protein
MKEKDAASVSFLSMRTTKSTYMDTVSTSTSKNVLASLWGTPVAEDSHLEIDSPFGQYHSGIPDLSLAAPKSYLHVFNLATIRDMDDSVSILRSQTNALKPHSQPKIMDPVEVADREGSVIEEPEFEENATDDINDNEKEGEELDHNTVAGHSPGSPCNPDTTPHDKTQGTAEQDRVHQDETIRDGKLREAPSQQKAIDALKDLREKLKPARATGRGYKDPGIDPFVRIRMDGMQTMLNFYTNPKSTTYDKWGASACQAAISMGRGRYCSRQLAKLSKQFIMDRAVLPVNPYGDWNESMLVDEDLVSDINLYLQELGKDITAQKVVEFLAHPDVKEKHGINRSITEHTARRYLNTLGYRWSAPKKGQYVDGHEHADVVWYREHKFLPAWREIQDRMYSWTKDNLPEINGGLPGRRVIVWFHDESIFYANDRQRKSWYHKDTPAKPYAKGEGASLMVADFVSADFGWLQSPDGKRSARRIMKPGKNRDGYFTAEDIDEQAREAMDILTECYPEYEHIFIYDNAPTHLKRPEDSLSAC